MVCDLRVACRGNQTAASDLMQTEFCRGGWAQQGQSSTLWKYNVNNVNIIFLVNSLIWFSVSHFMLFSCFCLISSQIYSLWYFVTASFIQQQKRWMQMKTAEGKEKIWVGNYNYAENQSSLFSILFYFIYFFLHISSSLSLWFNSLISFN